MKRILISLLFICLLLVFTACSQSEETPTIKAETRESVVTFEITDALGNEIVFEKVPSSIATFDSGILDILQKLDANITGRPTTSGDVDDTLENITEIGNPHQPNFEKIAEVKPEVLVVPPSFKQYEKNLKEQEMTLIYTQANSVKDIQETIHTFGVLLDKDDEAQTMNQEITDYVNEVKENKGLAIKTLLVYGAPGTYLAALPNSLSGDLLEKAGGENIAADFPKEEQYPQYASLSSEKIVEKNPEMIMLITHGDPEGVKGAFEEEMNKNATWKNLDAVKNDRVIVLPAHLFGSNPGTKVGDALKVMQENLSKVESDGNR